MALASVLVLGSTPGCGSSDPYAALRDTRVAREQRVLTGNPTLDRYFATVWEIQRALAAADLRRADALARLALTLGLTQDASMDRLADALRRQMTAHGIESVDVSVDHTQQTYAALQEWIAAVIRAPDGTADTRFVRLEGSLTVTVTFHGREVGAMTPAGIAASAVLRRADALQAVFEVLPPMAPELAAEGQALAQQMPRWRSELLAAVRFTQGLAPRATAHAEESRRLARWVRAALTPEQ